MQAIILAGGFGKRLRPLTDFVPKPLVPIGGVPLLEWQLRYLEGHGINDVTVCTGHLAGQVQDHVESRASKRMSVRVSTESRPLGTGGAIRNAGRHIRTKSFLVLNGDVITDIDLGAMQERADTVAGIELQTQFGTLDLSGDDITAFREKRPIPGVWMNAGIYHLSRSVLDELPVRGDIEKTLFPRMSRQGRLHVARFPDARWFSIESYKDIEECSRDVGSIFG